MSKVLAKFATAAAEIGNMKPNDAGNFGKFVNLAAILEAATPVLVAHGVNVVSKNGVDDEGRTTVTSFAVDLETGESCQIGYFAGAAANAQQSGSTLTYGQRYNLRTALGIAGDDDLDKAPKAARRSSKPSNDQPSVVRPSGQISETQRRALMRRDGKMDRGERLAMWAKKIGRTVESANELTKTEADTLLTEEER